MAKPLLSILLFIGVTFDSFSQNASLIGTITSSVTNDGLQGVNIVLKSTGHGTISGNHGDYQLGGIPEGKQGLLFSYMGYETLEKEVVFEEEGKSLTKC